MYEAAVSPVHSFSIAAIANYHKFSGLNQHTFITLLFSKQKTNMALTGLTSKYLPSCLHFWILYGIIGFLAFSSFWHFLIHGHLPPSSRSASVGQAFLNLHWSYPSLIASLCLQSQARFSASKDSCDDWAHLDNPGWFSHISFHNLNYICKISFAMWEWTY